MEEFGYLPIDSIIVKREARQRNNADPGDLTDSIKRLGVLNPIIIHKDNTLVAGERRLRAAQAAGLKSIPCRYFEDLSEYQLQLIELEENLKRKDLPWRDQVRALDKLHHLYLSANPKWTQQATAKAVGVSDTLVSMALRIAEDYSSPSISTASGIGAAFNILSRKDERASNDALSDIIEAGATFFSDKDKTEGDATDKPPPSLHTVDDDILYADFLEWAPSYSGPKFNFIHCDFPFGINYNNGPQSGRDRWIQYADDPEIYWKLVSCLCKHLDRLMTPDGHLVFWFSMEYYTATLAAFAKQAPSLAFDPFPLLWHKTDNVGILPDPKRSPRRIYETAFMASREDRLIVRATSNTYGAPTDKRYHPSTKPEPVLKYFFQMFVDASTRLLDPTCGSGSALRAAEELGAKQVLGLEVNEEFCVSARSALRSFRALREMTK